MSAVPYTSGFLLRFAVFFFITTFLPSQFIYFCKKMNKTYNEMDYLALGYFICQLAVVVWCLKKILLYSLYVDMGKIGGGKYSISP